MKKRLLYVNAIGVTMAVVLLLMGGLTAAQDQPKRGGNLRYGLTSEVPGIDPHVYVGTAGKTVTMCLYNSLVEYDKKGELVPGLAESWQTPDPKTYVFKIRKGVKFHKGQPFTARDVKYSLERILDPAAGATLRSNLEGIRIDIIDDYTIKISKDEPDASLIGNLAMPEAAMVSEEWMKTNPNIKIDANGTGPFSLANHEPIVKVVVKRNPDYWEKGLPYLDQVELIMIANSDARVNALRTKAVDMIEFVPWKDINLLKNEKGLEVQVAGGAFMNLWFNAKKKPFDDPRTRKAVSFAIDREAVSDAAFFGYGTPLYGPPTTPESWWYNKDLSKTFSYNPEKAKQLLVEAGYPKGFKTELLVLKTLTIFTQSAQVIQANLKDVGIDTDIKLMEWAAVVDNKNKGAYDFLVWGVNIKMADPDVYSYYFGAESTYWAKPIGYVDEKLETLLKQGRTTLDREQRKKIYRQVEERVLDLNLWTFINWRDQAQAYVNTLKGYVQLGGALSENSPGISMKALWYAK